MKTFSDAVEKIGDVQTGLKELIFQTQPSGARVYLERSLEALQLAAKKYTSEIFSPKINK